MIYILDSFSLSSFEKKTSAQWQVYICATIYSQVHGWRSSNIYWPRRPGHQKRLLILFTVFHWEKKYFTQSTLPFFYYHRLIMIFSLTPISCMITTKKVYLRIRLKVFLIHIVWSVGIFCFHNFNLI